MISFKTIGLNLFVEGFFVGLSIVIIGTLVSGIFALTMKSDLPPVCKDWNKNYIMELSLFLTGALTHLFFELLGLNSWYCKHGRACKK